MARGALDYCREIEYGVNHHKPKSTSQIPGRKRPCKSEGAKVITKPQLHIPSISTIESYIKRRKIELEEDVQVSKTSSDDVNIPESGSVDRYEDLDLIGTGAYGMVYKARDKITGELVAMKEEFHGLTTPCLREISVLKSVPSHPSIVGFKQVVEDGDDVYVVMELVENDLRRCIDMTMNPFHPIEVKRMMKQLLEGVKLLHENGFMHRNLNPSNILVNDKGQLKICDFNCSKRCDRKLSGPCTPHVGTLAGYKAPEIFIGTKKHSPAIDMWAVGCIMAELLSKEALFKGESEIRQLKEICRILDTHGFSSSPASMFEQCGDLLRNKYPMLTEVGFDLLSKLLAYDPTKRITAEAALDHDWFKEDPSTEL